MIIVPQFSDSCNALIFFYLHLNIYLHKGTKWCHMGLILGSGENWSSLVFNLNLACLTSWYSRTNNNPFTITLCLTLSSRTTVTKMTHLLNESPNLKFLFVQFWREGQKNIKAPIIFIQSLSQSFHAICGCGALKDSSSDENYFVSRKLCSTGIK